MCLSNPRVYALIQLSEMATELEDQRELATSRLTELEKLQKDHEEAVKDIETLKMDVRDLARLDSLLIVSCTQNCNKIQSTWRFPWNFFITKLMGSKSWEQQCF